MSNRIFVCFVLIIALSVWAGVASGKTLFSDDFEGDTEGAEPKNFEMYDHPHSKPGVFTPEVVEEPLGESGQCVSLNTSSVYVPKVAGRDNWANWVWEWDWMWATATAAPSTAFRVTEDKYYHFSPRADNQNIGLWLYDGGFQGISGLAAYDFGLSTWNRFQVSCIEDEITLKIKRRDDLTPFSEMKPLIQEKDGSLTGGPMSCSGIFKVESWMDNFIVGETEGDMVFSVESHGKLTTRWSEIKALN